MFLPPPGETELPQSAGSGRTLYPVWPSRNDGNVYVGTTANIVLEVGSYNTSVLCYVYQYIVMQGSVQRRFSMVLWGHTKPIAAISSHPTGEMSDTVTPACDPLTHLYLHTVTHACHPYLYLLSTDASFVTAGGDKVVAKWRRSKLLWKVTVPSAGLACCHHPGQ